MKDDRKTRKELLEALDEQQQRVTRLERSINRHKKKNDALMKSERRFRSIFENAPEGIFQTAPDGRLLSANPASAHMLGYGSPEDMKSSVVNLGKQLYVNAEDRSRVTKLVEERGVVKGFEVPFYSRDGSIVWVSLYVQAARDEDGNLFYQGTMENITERVKMERALRESEEKYRNILENIEEGYYEVDVAGNFTLFNSSMLKILGYPEEEMKGMNNRRYVSRETARKVFAAYNEVYRTGIASKNVDWEIIRKDGKKVFVETSVSLMKDAKGNTVGFRGIMHDVTDRKRMEEEIISLSITDHLTGLYNRRGFMTIAEQQMKIVERTKTGLLLLFADLDKMKWINDNLGHEKGDKALMDVASLLKGVFRKSDVIARIGGDEFAVLGIGASMKDGKALGSRLQHKIYIHNAAEKRDYKISLSVGMAYSEPENPCSLDELMSQADTRMYEQKRSKRS
jgi:diguanylate cyclase (GGDEF)-like protein/PAS domain S-box-containing protein